MFWTICANCSSDRRYPSSRPRWSSRSSSTASTTSCGVTSASVSLSCRVVAQIRLRHAPVLLPQRRHLPLLEIGLREDLAVDLDQHLLDDLGPRRGRDNAHNQSGQHPAPDAPQPHRLTAPTTSLQSNAYPSQSYARSESSVRRPITRSNTPPSARGSSAAGRVRFSFVNPGVTSPAVARCVHHDLGEYFLSFDQILAGFCCPRLSCGSV